MFLLISSYFFEPKTHICSVIRGLLAQKCSNCLRFVGENRINPAFSPTFASSAPKKVGGIGQFSPIPPT